MPIKSVGVIKHEQFRERNAEEKSKGSDVQAITSVESGETRGSSLWPRFKIYKASVIRTSEHELIGMSLIEESCVHRKPGTANPTPTIVAAWTTQMCCGPLQLQILHMRPAQAQDTMKTTLEIPSMPYAGKENSEDEQ